MIKKILVLSLLTLLFLPGSEKAQIDMNKDRIWVQFNPLIPANEFNFERGLKFTYDARALWRHNLAETYGLEIGAGYANYKGIHNLAPFDQYYQTTIIGADGRFLYMPFKFEQTRPYFYGGLGLFYFNVVKDTYENWNNNVKGLDKSGVALQVPIGLGFEYYFADNFAVDLSAGLMLSTTDLLNHFEDGSLTDGYYKFGLGLHYKFSGPADSDKDGLTDNEEKQIGTDPMNPDTDGDKIKDIDEVRKTNTNPTKADTDNDGLNDYEEIYTYKTDPKKADTDNDKLSDGDEVNRYKTDPLKDDTDGDYLTDGNEVMTYKTNPLNKDTDGDTLADNDELQKYRTDPLKADTDSDTLADNVEINSHKTDPTLYDTDADGLNDADEINKYKTNPLEADTDKGSVNDGVEVKRGTDALNADDDIIKAEVAIVLEGITFETGKAEIKPESEIKLNEALRTLNVYSEIVVEVSGHTDNVGNAAKNKTLSQERAESVRNWLIEKGIDAERLVAKGYGADKPIANNKTAEGKAKNRRIEFKRIR
ncbi:MAG: OmpA family protein [Ignavibacteriales bacterium]|nr:OmpA family protein [Ignavibacteriales bacterium]MCF8306662.1 OmpA family protein [Ignavibacteriales bacterium]MCF8316238.1 OmpA family protein [Ignavibacteriales bacterium]MCF8437822.1 OmpA family protein [Ignavibacteriales bacterium]